MFIYYYIIYIIYIYISTGDNEPNKHLHSWSGLRQRLLPFCQDSIGSSRYVSAMPSGPSGRRAMTGQTFQKMTTLTTTNTTHSLVESFWDATLFAGGPGFRWRSIHAGIYDIYGASSPERNWAVLIFGGFLSHWGAPQIIQTHCDLGTSSLTCFCSELLTYLFQLPLL